MASSADAGGRYTGAAGRTRTAETTVWCGGCGGHYGGRYHLSLDADASPALLSAFLEQGFAALNGMACGRCAATHVAEEALLVHRPRAQQLLVVVPDGLRHRAQQIRAEALRAVAEAPGDTVPPYALSPELVSVAQLRARLQAPEPSAAPEAPARVVEIPAPIEVAVAPARPAAPSSAPPIAPAPVSEPPTASVEVEAEPDLVSVDLDDVVPPPAAAAPPVPGRSGLLAELLQENHEPPPPPVPSEPEEDERWEALDAGWSVEEAPADNDPTHVVRTDDVLGELRERGPTFDVGLARDQDAYVHLRDGMVHAAVRLAAERAAAFETGMGELRFQLHQPEPGPVLALLLCRIGDAGEVEDHVLWVLEHETPAHEAVLGALQQSFAVEVAFHRPDGTFHGRRVFRSPLEANVASARKAVARIEGEQLWDRGAARRAVSAPEYDRLGRLKHNFHRESFADVRSAADARLALGILAYWSAPERRDYLLRIKAFPEPWFETMVRRILDAALSFGLAMEPHLRQRALDLGLAESSSALVRRSLANFAEVNLNLKPSELDPLDIWDNWEALLAHAEELDLRVDEEIEELAAQAMDRAREAAQTLDPIEINADDESIELEEVADLSDLSDVDLVTLLQDPAHRLDAALGLLHRGEAVYVQTVFDAIKVMNRDELLRVVPAALAMGPAFEQSFLTGLRSRRVSLRLASALFLAEIRSERAAAPVLALIPRAGASEWPILARAAARMGRRILKPALRLAEAKGDRGDRLAHTLALLGADARGALAAARDQQTDDAARACLVRALDQMAEVSFADAADFTERLADAFQAAGPDQVGPDFEEDLESVDLGPGASIGDLEAEVSLDSLDRSK